MKEQQLISVLLPVHNSASTLEECVFSILNQSYRNIEIIAMDDFSTDHSFSILQKIKKQDKRLRVYKNVKRYGIAVTLNRLVKKARGSYIAFMDTDDFSGTDRLKKQLNFLINNENVVAVGSQCTFVNEDGKKIGKSDFPLDNSYIYKNPLHGISMQFETVLVNKSLLPKDVLNFNVNSNPFIYSDIFMKLIPYGKFANLNQFLHYHRNDPQTYLSDLKKNIISLIKLWIKSKALYDYNPPFRSFFSPIIKSV
jgi:glycosyltransferase involved in cell wall biosynthesis